MSPGYPLTTTTGRGATYLVPQGVEIVLLDPRLFSGATTIIDLASTTLYALAL